MTSIYYFPDKWCSCPNPDYFECCNITSPDLMWERSFIRYQIYQNELFSHFQIQIVSFTYLLQVQKNLPKLRDVTKRWKKPELHCHSEHSQDFKTWLGIDIGFCLSYSSNACMFSVLINIQEFSFYSSCTLAYVS